MAGKDLSNLDNNNYDNISRSLYTIYKIIDSCAWRKMRKNAKIPRKYFSLHNQDGLFYHQMKTFN